MWTGFFDLMKYLFCAYRRWALELHKKLAKKHKGMRLLNKPKKLTYSYVRKLNPDFIFFPDWSWIVPHEIFSNFNCVCFHESNLPKFRGGSPIQNQIIRGITKTKTTAFLMNEGLGEGDVLLQRDLSLKGSLDEIFARMIKNDFEMINLIIAGQFKRRKQSGKSTLYKRRKPEQSELKHLNYSKKYLYNFIRMLTDPYPNAFIRIGKRKIVFKGVKFKNKKLTFEGELV